MSHPPTLHQRVEEALKSVRGYLQADGGDLRIHQVTEEGQVQIELLGSCSACSMSDMTMKIGVEEAIRKAVPEVTSVVTVDKTTQ